MEGVDVKRGKSQGWGAKEGNRGSRLIYRAVELDGRVWLYW